MPSSTFDWSSLVGPALQAGAGLYGSSAGSSAYKQGLAGSNAQQGVDYNTVAGLYQPEQTLGVGAVSSLGAALGLNGQAPNYAGFENSPGYQFTQQMGDQGIQRAAAAGGNLYSTSTIANLDKYNTGLASQTYQNYVGNLLSAAGLGNTANSGIANARLQTGNNVSQALIGAGAQNQSAVAGGVGAVGSLLGKIPGSAYSSAYNWLTGGGGAAPTTDSLLGLGAADSAAADVSGVAGATADATASGISTDLSSLLGGGSIFNTAGGGAAAAGGGAAAGADAAAAAGGADVGAGTLGTLGGLGLAGGALAGLYGIYALGSRQQSPASQANVQQSNAAGLLKMSGGTAGPNPGQAASNYYANMMANPNNPSAWGTPPWVTGANPNVPYSEADLASYYATEAGISNLLNPGFQPNPTPNYNGNLVGPAGRNTQPG